MDEGQRTCAGSARESGDLGFGQRKDTVGPHREGEAPKPMMHEPEKSGSAIAATKSANKAGQPVAKLVERRAWREERTVTLTHPAL
jgi:hypothetical protein